MQPNEPIIQAVEPANSRQGDGLRCGCGSLLARIIKKGIELKCRRCKGKTLIPLSGIADDVKQNWSEILKAG